MSVRNHLAISSSLSVGKVEGHNHLKDMQRDGHCHEAVMWLVHHVPAAEQQTVFATQKMAPLLPLTDHSDTCAENASASELEVCKVAQGQRSCADCHSGSGIIMQVAVHRLSTICIDSVAHRIIRILMA